MSLIDKHLTAKIIKAHPSPWRVEYAELNKHQYMIDIFSANGDEPTGCLCADEVDLTMFQFMVDAVNRQYGPPICDKCDKPSGGRLGHWCEPCREEHVKELKLDIDKYQSPEKRKDRESAFNSET